MEKIDLYGKTIFVTGVAGFIGSNVASRLLEEYHCKVVGIDNMNDYYDVKIKEWRLEKLKKLGLAFIKGDLSDRTTIDNIFETYKPAVVVNLGAQAGVRYSIENPDTYISSNVIGFYNILEACRWNNVEHLVYASSSSVYGSNKKVPYSVDDKSIILSLFMQQPKNQTNSWHMLTLNYIIFHQLVYDFLQYMVQLDDLTWPILDLPIN